MNVRWLSMSGNGSWLKADHIADFLHDDRDDRIREKFSIAVRHTILYKYHTASLFKKMVLLRDSWPLSVCKRCDGNVTRVF